MTQKRKPTYDIEAFKSAFASVERLSVTGTALRSAAALGFGRGELYVKFTADAVTEFLLLSFKEKGDD